MMEEHAPRNKSDSDKGASTYSPSPEESKTIRLVDSYFDKAKKHREKYDGEWMDYYHMFRGKQWKEKRPAYRHSEVLNLIFRSIQSTIPIQLDVNPKIEFIPEEPSDIEFSKIMNHVLDSDWDREGWARTILEVVYDANLYGSGLSQQTYDADADFKAGKIIYESADPFYCFPDPSSKDVNRGGCYFIYAEPMDIGKAKAKWPEFKEYLKSDLVDLIKGDKTDLKVIRYRSPVDQRSYVEADGSKKLELEDKILVKTCWILPEGTYEEFDEQEVETADPQTGVIEKTYVQKAKFPRGRKIVVANGVLLEDQENPYQDGQIPFAKYDNYVLPREFWGESEVQQLAGPQRTINKIFSFILDVMTLTGNPIWKVHASANVDTDNLVNKPGLAIEWAGDHEPKREEGTQLQPFILQTLNTAMQVFDSISGANDVTRGIRPEGVTAASAIDALQDAAQTRIRGKSKQLDHYLQPVGQQLSSRMLQFYTAPRVVRITNDQNANQYFKFQADPEKGIVTIKTIQPDGTEGLAQDIKIGKLDVRVRTGSALPFAKAQKKQELTKLFEMGVIDDEELLKNYDFPGWEAVLQRVNEKKQMAAEQQAAAGGQ